MRMVYGHHNWPLAHRVLGDRVFFLHRGGSVAAGASGSGEGVLGAKAGVPGTPLLLAYSPSVPLWRLRTHKDLTAVLHALATVGGVCA